MVPIVGLSLLMLAILLLLLTGALVLLYSTHYTLRGCHSNNGLVCGTFSVYISGTVGFGLWGLGAALSLLYIMLFVEAVQILVIILGFYILL